MDNTFQFVSIFLVESSTLHECSGDVVHVMQSRLGLPKVLKDFLWIEKKKSKALIKFRFGPLQTINCSQHLCSKTRFIIIIIIIIIIIYYHYYYLLSLLLFIIIIIIYYHYYYLLSLLLFIIIIIIIILLSLSLLLLLLLLSFSRFKSRKRHYMISKKITFINHRLF